MKRLSILAAALAAACASAPEENAALVQARSAFANAQQNPHVVRFAPQELAEARQALERAERVQAAAAGDEWISHHAYLAEREARVASNVGMTRAAETELAQAERERERVLLDARTREAQAADLARAQAEARLREMQAERAAALQQAEQARTQAEQARTQAEQAAQVRAQEQDKRAQEQDALRAEISRLGSQVAALQTKETERGMVLTLGAEVLFDSGQATLKPGARRALANVARLMQRRSDLDIVVEGFTDNVGGEGMNQALSERRAQAVKRALVDEGVAAERIAARGMGEAFPVASNASPAGRQLNRRVEIVIPRENAAVGR